MPAASETKSVDPWTLRRAWAGVILTGVLSLFALGAIWLDAVSDSYSPLEPSLFLSLSILAAVWLVASTPNVPDGPSPWAQQVCAVVLALLAVILVTATLGFVWTIIASGGMPVGPIIGSATVTGGTVTSGSGIASIFPGPPPVDTWQLTTGPTSSAQLAQVIMTLAGGIPAAIAFWWAIIRLRELGHEFQGWIAGAVGIVLIMILSLVSSHPAPFPTPMQGQPGIHGNTGSGKIQPGSGGFSTQPPDNTSVTPY